MTSPQKVLMLTPSTTYEATLKTCLPASSPALVRAIRLPPLGAGNDIRFDFASLGILNDGGVVVAYHDSTDPDPLFAVELEMPA